MMRLWASLSGKVCETGLMKTMRPYVLLRPIGIDASISCAGSYVRQFLSFVFKQCSLYSCEAGHIRSTILRLQGGPLGCLSCYQGDQSIFRGS
jgi:hypothetical protein